MRYIAYGLAIFAAVLTVGFATGYLPRDATASQRTTCSRQPWLIPPLGLLTISPNQPVGAVRVPARPDVIRLDGFATKGLLRELTLNYHLACSLNVRT